MNLDELELWHRRHEELGREAENRRFVRRLRKERPRSSSRSGRGIARLHETITLWEGTNVPFFRA
jgi:hypothetical protein